MPKKSGKTSKVLVRNPSVPLRPTKVLEKTHGLKKVHFVEDAKPEADQLSLLSPEFCTLLQVADEMKSIRNAQGSSRCQPEVTRCRNLNFLPEEKIYQDLVGLEISEEQLTNEAKSQPSRVSLRKDPELDVNKYLKYSLQPEFFFSSHAVPVLKKQKPVFDGCSMYNKLKTWKRQIE